MQFEDSLKAQMVKNLPIKNLILGLIRSPGEGSDYPLQHFCLKNSMDKRAWWATIHGVAKSQTWLSD